MAGKRNDVAVQDTIGPSSNSLDRDTLTPSKSTRRISKATFRRAVRFQRTALRKVAFEMRRVDFDGVNVSRSSEFDDGPIVSWTATSFRFPAIAHVRGASGHD